MDQNVRIDDRRGRRPLAAIVSCSRIIDGRGVQAVADRFLTPVSEISGLIPLVVPSTVGLDARALSATFDALILTGSCSNVHPSLYGGIDPLEPIDRRRDSTALSLADAMISSGKPVFGICRGLQELNVLYGGSLHRNLADRSDLVHMGGLESYENAIGSVLHPVEVRGGMLGDARSIEVVSAHRQGIDMLGKGLHVEANAPDGLVEAISDRSHGAVLGVQWHPEWDVASSPSSRGFFETLGRAARGWRMAA